VHAVDRGGRVLVAKPMSPSDSLPGAPNCLRAAGGDGACGGAHHGTPLRLLGWMRG
jgi:hypothetical protein